MSENTVRKYIRQLEEQELLFTEPTEIMTRAGQKRNRNLHHTLRPTLCFSLLRPRRGHQSLSSIAG